MRRSGHCERSRHQGALWHHCSDSAWAERMALEGAWARLQISASISSHLPEQKQAQAALSTSTSTTYQPTGEYYLRIVITKHARSDIRAQHSALDVAAQAAGLIQVHKHSFHWPLITALCFLPSSSLGFTLAGYRSPCGKVFSGR